MDRRPEWISFFTSNAGMLRRFTERKLNAVVCLMLLAFSCQFARSQSPTPPIPPPVPFRYVVDNANVIDELNRQKLESILERLKAAANIEFAVVTIKTTGGQDIFDYGLALARGWGIGSKEGEKDGILLLLAVDDRKWNVQISRHLEGDLPDGLTDEINRRMREPLRAGKYGDALLTAVQTYVATLEKARNFSVEGVDSNFAVTEQRRTGSRQKSNSLSACVVIFIIVFVIIILFAGRGGSGWGCLSLLLLNSLFNSDGRGSGMGSGGWGGGGFGGGGGGFGGGGDFGGGGSSGSW